MTRLSFAWPLAALACFASSAARADDFPDALDFTDQPGAQRSQTVTSDARLVQGIDETVAISILGCNAATACEYRVNAGAWVSTPGTAVNGDSVRLRMITSPGFNDTSTLDLQVGSAQVNWQAFNVGEPAAISVESGNQQKAPVGTAYALVQVRVTDGNGNPIADQPVTFGPSPIAAGVTFGGGGTSSTLPTDTAGRVAVLPVANNVPGSFGLPVTAHNTGTTVNLENTVATLTHTNFVSFPEVNVGQTRSIQLDVANSGQAPGQILGIQSAHPGIGIVIGACATIAPGANCSVEITYTPQRAEFANGQFTLVTNSQPPAPPVNFNGIASNPPQRAAESVPGTTLLYPYFEVDPAGNGGRNTLLSWRNTGATALLTHVTVWSDYGIPVLTFNTYLTGFDVITLDMYSLLVEGRIPRTATDGQDPTDRISPQGPFSQDINFASCGSQLPYPDPVLTPAFRADLVSGLAGGPMLSRNARCVAARHGDAILRGYVTIDTVNHCTQQPPTDPGYYTNAITFQNALSGEFLLVEPQARTASLAQAAAIEGDPSGNNTTPGDVSFYASFNGSNGSDRREGLPTTWAVDANAQDVELLVWREPKRANANDFSCSATAPAGFPLSAERVLAFDNEEQPTTGSLGAFPLATQRVALGSAGLPAPARTGWIYLGLSHAGNVPHPSDPLAAQAWVSVLQRLDDPSRSGADAFPLDRADAARHVHPN